MDHIHNQKPVETVSLNEKLHQSKEEQGCSFTWHVLTEDPESVLQATGKLVSKQHGPCPSGPILWYRYREKR